MDNSKINRPEDNEVLQIIDANLDRAREGLRVIEDWSRFGLGRKDLVDKIKNFRQILGRNHLNIYKESRNLIQDNCRGVTHREQFNRKIPEDLISSNSARVQEALRVIEEFSRDHNIQLSKKASEIRYEIYDLELELLNMSTRKKLKGLINENNLYLITDKKKNLLESIENILQGGVRIVQHRFKDGKDKDHLDEAIEIKKLCKKYNSLFIINDRIDIALASNADGIHLGQSDLDIKVARKLLGNSKIIGISANNIKDIINAEKNGCDYIGIGPVFKTSTKKNKYPIGIEMINYLTKDINVPWFAIGGITKENISTLTDNGIKKVAIISGLLNAKNPKEEVIMILKKLSNEN